MVIENTVEATPIIEPDSTVRMLFAPSGWAGTIQCDRLSHSAAPIRSRWTSSSASKSPPAAKSAG